MRLKGKVFFWFSLVKEAFWKVKLPTSGICCSFQLKSNPIGLFLAALGYLITSHGGKRFFSCLAATRNLMFSILLSE
ncbi:hypothetical protein CYJ36_17850 [Bacillus sp. UMB0893]|nr:hypothetical protein CYJ36_17850 [Bacillus sp. UMB0893]